MLFLSTLTLLVPCQWNKGQLLNLSLWPNIKIKWLDLLFNGFEEWAFCHFLISFMKSCKNTHTFRRCSKEGFKLRFPHEPFTCALFPFPLLKGNEDHSSEYPRKRKKTVRMPHEGQLIFSNQMCNMHSNYSVKITALGIEYKAK